MINCATLERISLENYNPDHEAQWSPDNLRLRRLSITNLSFLVPNLALDPMALRSLHIRLPGHITQSSEQISAFRSFLFQCHRLEDLDVDGAINVFNEPLLAAIGRNLLYLRLKNLLYVRFQEVQTLPIMGDFSSPAVISRNCPNLRKLGIDIGHSRRWVDWVSLNNESLLSLMLTAIPRVSHMTFYHQLLSPLLP